MCVSEQEHPHFGNVHESGNKRLVCAGLGMGEDASRKVACGVIRCTYVYPSHRREEPREIQRDVRENAGIVEETISSLQDGVKSLLSDGAIVRVKFARTEHNEETLFQLAPCILERKRFLLHVRHGTPPPLRHNSPTHTT